jgi:hypothetical protein
LDQTKKEEIDERINRTSAEISNSGYFEAPSTYQFPWSHQEGVDSFIGFLNTTSSFLVLSESEQTKFIAELKLLFPLMVGLCPDIIYVVYLLPHGS